MEVLPASSARMFHILMYTAIIAWLTFLTVNSPTSITRSLDAPVAIRPTFRPTTDVPAGTSQPLLSAASLPAVPVNESWRFPQDMPFLEALKTCETLNCVRDAHRQPRGEAKFNFPHFVIAGWPKAATTSLYLFLIKHSQILNPAEKEPGLFSVDCNIQGTDMICPPSRMQHYIEKILKRDQYIESNGQMAAFEATPRTVELGYSLAPALREVMPWLKIIANLREPISRRISWYVFNEDKFQTGCLHNNTLTWCMFNEVNPRFGIPMSGFHSRPLRAYFDHFPADQITLVQYEELTGPNEAKELQRVKKFLGLDPTELEDTLDKELVNCRHCEINPEGWPMSEELYRKLIDLVMPDVLEVVKLVDKYNIGSGARWMENWQKVWDANLATCVEGECKIKLS